MPPPHARAWRGVLVAGMAAALAVVAVSVLRQLLAAPSSFGRGIDLLLVSGLLVAAGSAAAYHALHRRDAEWRTTAAAANTARALDRAHDLERLVDLARGMARALDVYSFREAVEASLPALTGNRDAWLLVRVGGRWESIAHVHPAGRRVSDEERARIAGEVIALPARDGRSPAAPVVLTAHTCFPLVSEGLIIGVLGVAHDARGEPDAPSQDLLTTSAALLAVAARNIELVREIRDTSVRDTLTGCFTRAHGVEALSIELRRASRTGAPLSVLMLDVDHFKPINDRFGHLAGDAALGSVGRLLLDTLRSTDIKIRYGGEEFLVILPDTGPEAAVLVAESVRAAIAATELAGVERPLSVTVSIGVATAQYKDHDPALLIARADEALYEAKRAGRNRVRSAPPRDESPQPPSSRRIRTQPRVAAPVTERHELG